MKHIMLFVFIAWGVFSAPAQSLKQALVRVDKFNDMNALEYRWEFSYNNYGQEIQATEYHYSSPGLLSSVTRTIKVYDFYSGQIRDLYRTELDFASNAWRYRARELFHYTQDSLLDVHTVYNFDAQSGWVPDNKLEFTYNAAGLKTAEEFFLYNSQQWSPYRLWNYSYDAQNRLTEIVMRHHDGQAYQNMNREVHSYNSAGLLWRVDYFDYNLQNQAWDTVFRAEYAYTPQNKIDSIFFWRMTNGTWEPRAIYKLYYTNGVLDALEVRLYNPRTSTWDVDIRTNYDKDASVLREDLLLPDNPPSMWEWDEVVFDSKLDVSRTFWFPSPGNPAFVGRYEYFYQPQTVLSAGARELEEIALYPNPASDQVRVSAPDDMQTELVIYTTDGRRVLATREGRADVSELPAGTYVYKIITDQGAKSGILLKE